MCNNAHYTVLYEERRASGCEFCSNPNDPCDLVYVRLIKVELPNEIWWPYRDVYVYETRVIVSHEEMFHTRKIGKDYTNNATEIRAAIALFDDALAHHPEFASNLQSSEVKHDS